MFQFIRKPKMKKRAKNWTRYFICISIFQVFHPTDVEIKVSKRSLPSKRRWFCFFNLYNISRGVRGLLTITDLAMIMPLTTWHLKLDFRFAEKEKLPKQHLFAQPWWSRLWSACLAIRRISKVISRKRIGQTVLHRPYLERNTEHFQYFVRDMNSPVAPPEGFFGVK